MEKIALSAKLLARARDKAGRQARTAKNLWPFAKKKARVRARQHGKFREAYYKAQGNENARAFVDAAVRALGTKP
jgi:DNA helicase IV